MGSGLVVKRPGEAESRSVGPDRDVDRLVALSKDLPRFRIALSAIFELDQPYWFSGGAGAATCRAVIEHARSIEEADLSFPIILSWDGRVMDGMHRVGKALLNGQADIEAVRFVRDPEPDYVGVDPEELPYEESGK